MSDPMWITVTKKERSRPAVTYELEVPPFFLELLERIVEAAENISRKI